MAKSQANSLQKASSIAGTITAMHSSTAMDKFMESLPKPTREERAATGERNRTQATGTVETNAGQSADDPERSGLAGDGNKEKNGLPHASGSDTSIEDYTTIFLQLKPAPGGAMKHIYISTRMHNLLTLLATYSRNQQEAVPMQTILDNILSQHVKTHQHVLKRIQTINLRQQASNLDL